MKPTVLLLPAILVLASCARSERYVIVLEDRFVARLSSPGDRKSLFIKDPLTMPKEKHHIMVQEGEFLIYSVQDIDFSIQNYWVPIITESGIVVSSNPPGKPGSIAVTSIGYDNGRKFVTFERT
jgi:hypothetical protein